MAEQEASAGMLKIAVIAITANGKILGEKIQQDWSERENVYVQRFTLWKYAGDDDIPFLHLYDLTSELYTEYDALVYLCSCGIAVRMIAPHIRGNLYDPAVVAIDERGKYAVSLLAGNLCFANVLTRISAIIIGAESVVTTASDAGGRFQPELYAQTHDMWIADMNMAKKIEAEAAAGKFIGWSTEYINMSAPEGTISWADKGWSYGVHCGTHPDRSPFKKHTLMLQPRNLCIGVFCKNGTSAKQLESFVQDAFEENHLPIQRVCYIASIDSKKGEKAIVALAKKLGVRFGTYSPEKLNEVGGDFEHSELLMQKFGVDNVCERSAAADGRRLILTKQKGSGMALAVAEARVYSFEE